MRARRIARLGVTATVALGAATALAADEPPVWEANLDRDAALEQVTFDSPSSASTHGPNRGHRVRISDTCPEGPVTEYVSDSAQGERPATLRIKTADTRAGKEVFFVLDNPFGRGGPIGAGLIAWRSYASAPCRRARTLFRYDPERREYPSGASLLTDAEITLANYSKRYRGKEVRLDESYSAEGENTTSESILRRTFYRYNPRRDRHTRYRRVIKRNQTP